MENDCEFWISYIIADYIPFNSGNRQMFISSPSRECKFLAEDIFLQYYDKAIEDGNLSEQEINILLERYGIWGSSNKEKLEKILKDIEDIKVSMYEYKTSKDKLNQLRVILSSANSTLENLVRMKQSFDSIGAKSAAQYCKQHFLLGCSIFAAKGKPFWKNPSSCWTKPDQVLNDAYRAINKFVLVDSDYRELARSSVWRSIWSTRKGLGTIFGRPVVDISSAQRHLVSWSNLYDNVYKHSECPSDEVIEDDDLLDGWMIIQKRKRENEINKNSIANTITNSKIAGAEEIFICVNEETFPVGGDIDKRVKAVYEMNDIAGKIGFQRRMAQIKKEGIVDESNMVDRRLELQQAAARIGVPNGK